MSADTLRIERSPNGVVTVTIARPERKNALDMPLFGALRDAFRELGDEAGARVVVLTGEGDAFCSGADIGTVRTGETQPVLVLLREIHDMVLALHQISKPVIAKVNGVAAGAGLSLALGCDLIVASDRARFSAIFTRRGLSPDCGGSWLLPRLVGLHRAKELALLADMYSAAEAERMGLVNRVVPHAELDAFVADWAERLAAGPPLALSMSKRLIDGGLNASLLEALENEAMAAAVNNATDDMKEAFRAFREKRDPHFRGR
jgi:2-(1,2-epoxy-1,2-dihydrophenyl)acetyl-CoA isomerase